ncbi:MAG: glycosyltransferase [bacterium]
MKIAFLTTWEIRCGIAEYSAHFCKALAKQGDDIEVVELPPAMSREEAGDIAARMNDADVAHIQHEFSFFGRVSLGELLQRLKIPSVMTIHEFPKVESSLSNPLGKIKQFFHLSLIRRYFRIPNRLVFRFIVHSDYSKTIQTHFGTPAEKIVVFPHPVPEREKTPDGKNTRAKFALGEKVVLTIFGFVNNRKGYEIALEALAYLPSNYVLLIAGGAHPRDRSGYEPALRKKVESLGCASRVIITDFVERDDLPGVMDATDLVLTPFLEMSNSGSLSVAIGYGKAVVASDLPPNRELYENGKCIEMFKTGSSRDLARAITHLIETPGARTALEERAAGYAKDYSYLKTAGVLQGIYEDALGERDRR